MNEFDEAALRVSGNQHFDRRAIRRAHASHLHYRVLSKRNLG
jgi:transposase-like protein